MISEWLDVGTIENIPLRGARTVSVEEKDDVAVFRTGEGRIYALVNKCPHKQGPLSQGIVHGDSVSCPLHNWGISLATGRAQGDDDGCTPTIPVKIVDGRIMIHRASILLKAA